jgi:hypothetical protein
VAYIRSLDPRPRPRPPAEPGGKDGERPKRG